jgi:hypothetical protein
MVFWQRALILLAAMIGVSVFFGAIWNSVFGFELPGYASGVIGGLTAVPVWDLLKKVKLKT